MVTDVHIEENKDNPFKGVKEDSTVEIKVDISNKGDELNLLIVLGYHWVSFKVCEYITHLCVGICVNGSSNHT